MKQAEYTPHMILNIDYIKLIKSSDIKYFSNNCLDKDASITEVILT